MKVITIGRSNENDVRIENQQVSRHHCQIVQHDDGSFSIVDFGSSNGTFVNGVRINGQVSLKNTDSVKVGNTELSWQKYFTSSVSKTKSSSLPRVLGIVGGVLALAAIVLVVILLNKGNENPQISNGGGNNSHNREFYIGGVSLGFDMTQDDLFKENPGANIVAKHAPGGTLPAHDYYEINNNLAVTFEQSSNVQESQINQIVIWDPTFVINNIHVNAPFSRVMNEYKVDKSNNNTGTLSFWYVSSWYDYRSQSFTGAICVYDAATCTGYLLFKSEFSASLWQGITAAVGNVNSNGEFSLASLSMATYQSIYSSVTVSQIVKYNCANKQASPFVGRGQPPQPFPSQSLTDLTGTVWVCERQYEYEYYKLTLEFLSNNRYRITKFSSDIVGEETKTDEGEFHFREEKNDWIIGDPVYCTQAFCIRNDLLIVYNILSGPGGTLNTEYKRVR